MKSITVFVMLDACRPDYLDKKTTPFLHGLASSGISGRIQPTFGFEPDAAYLAGLFPDQADGGAQFWHDPEKSPFPAAAFLPKALNRLPALPRKVIRKLMEKAARRQFAFPNLSTANIPFHLLSRFAFPMTVNLDEPDFCPPFPTVFDLLRTEGREWLFHGAPKHRVTIKAACTRADKQLLPPLSFAFFHIGNLDGTGHRYGPDSLEIKRELTMVDEGLSKIHAMANARFDTVHFMVMGDHGMMKVTKHVDIHSVLAPLDLVQGKDYLYILDSTMARFWFFSDKAEAQVSSVMASARGGRILDRNDRDRYHLNYGHNRFGDMIFLADPGCLIFPSYYQDHAPVLGMHGYAPETSEQQALFIINSSRAGSDEPESPVDMRRVFPTLCDLLDISRPHSCGLESLVTS